MRFLRIWAALSDCNFEVGERSEVGDLEGTTMSFNARTQSAQEGTTMSFNARTQSAQGRYNHVVQC